MLIEKTLDIDNWKKLMRGEPVEPKQFDEDEDEEEFFKPKKIWRKPDKKDKKVFNEALSISKLSESDSDKDLAQAREIKKSNKECEEDKESKVFEANMFYQKNPVTFCRDFLNLICDPWQVEAFNALVKDHYVAVRSGSGVGKTAWLAMALIWFLRTHPMSKVPATAPTQHQLFDLLWSECFRWIQRSDDLKRTLTWTQSKIGVKGFEPSWYAAARTATAGADDTISASLQGFHSDDSLLYIMDEASGVPDSIIPAFEGALTGSDSYAIITGNPTRRSGYFYDIFHKPKTGSRYHKIHVSCVDTPRVSEQYVEMMKERYGESHPLYRIKVLGEFAEASDDLLFPPEYLETMQSNIRDEVISQKLPIEIGIDIGRVSALSIATVRQGLNILAFIEHDRVKGAVNDALKTSDWISNIINDYDPDIVRVDGIGIGITICDILKDKFGDKIYSFVGSARAVDNLRFLNLRAEGFWLLREKLSKLWAEHWPDKLIREISEIKQKESKNGKLQIESKEEMLSRSMKSPDSLDSLMYAFANNCDEEILLIPSKFCNKVIEINDSMIKPSWVRL